MKMMIQYILETMDQSKLIICGNKYIDICIYRRSYNEYTYYCKGVLVVVLYGNMYEVIRRHDKFIHKYLSHSVCNDAFITYYKGGDNNDTFYKILKNFLIKPPNKVGMLQTRSYTDITCIADIKNE
jgi:hypothetical protein